MISDTKPVRPGEEIDKKSLASYLREQMSELIPGDIAAIEVEQFPGGHSNLTYLIRVSNQEFVLRRPPFGPVAPTAHDMPREFRLLSAVHQHFPLAPRPLRLCEDNAVIGAPFYIMERRRGFIIRTGMPAEIADDLTLPRRISEAMVDTLVSMHSIDIYSSGLVNIGKPTGFLQRQVRGWAERWQRCKTGELPEIDQVVCWLIERMPADPERASLIHNDFKLDNVMLDATNPAQVIAVLDWEMSTVGDPLVDLGIMLGYWAQPSDPPARRGPISPVTVEPGWMTREAVIARYAEKTGRDLSNINFYQAFALFKVSVVLQQIYFRFVQGQTQDKRFKNFDQLVAGLARAALDLTRD